MSEPQVICPICEQLADCLGLVYGQYSRRNYKLYRCASCHFAFIADPWIDYAQIYTQAYYEGLGADPLVDYPAEVREVNSIRRLEWRGILKWMSSVGRLDGNTRWLDYGCGVGGLVKYLREEGIAEAYGYDQSYSVSSVEERVRTKLSSEELEEMAGTFDVVTAIEVIEHVPDPVSELRRIRSLLRPGGHLLLTTTNSSPYRDRLLTWRYVIPEIHVSFFEPRTLGLALERAGYRAEYLGYSAGWTDIVRFKFLKNIGRTRTHAIDAIVPWAIVSRILDWRLELSAQPIGRAM